jgi:hypothetical protein
MQTATVTGRRNKSSETPQEALARIQSMHFCGNDVLVIQVFSEAGIPPEQIDPRNNVLTFNAWKAKSRRVAKGAKSIRVTVWIPIRDRNADAEPDENGDGEKKKRNGMRPKLTRLFHLCQTVDAEAEKGTRPKAWQNPALVREGTYEPEEEPAGDVESGPVAHVPQWMADAFGMEAKPGHIEITPASECNCPMGGVVINVDCPVHGTQL